MLVLLALLLSSSNIPAQNLRFEHITSDNGLSQNTVMCILQDSRGFMWFGTWNGLNRFDGYSFKTFKSSAQNSALSNNFIYSICEDQRGDLWIGTKNGLNRFLYAKNKFVNYFHDPDDPNSISSDWIKSVVCDNKGRIWIGTAEHGVDCLTPDPASPSGFTVRRFRFESSPILLPDDRINRIYEDRNNNIWIGTENGLARISADLSAVKIYRNDFNNSNSLSYNIVSSIFEDRDGLIWIGTHFGLNKYDPQSDTFHRYYFNPYNPSSLSHSVIHDIAEDPNGTILIGTLGGLNTYNPENDGFNRFPGRQNDNYSLNNEFINAIFTDNQGNVWIGTDKGGVNKYNVYQKPFGHMAHDQTDENSLSHNTINSLLDEPSALWIGTAGGGLNKYDKRQKNFRVFKNMAEDPHGLNNDFITFIHRDRKQNLWIGTWGGGINKSLSLHGNGSFKKYLPVDGDENSLCNVYVSSLWEDENGLMLIGTLGGLDYLDPAKETFKHIGNHPGWENRITEVGCILKDRHDYYWIGSRVGLFRIKVDKLENASENDIEKFTHSPADSLSLPGNYVISLYEDRMGRIWLGTYGNGFARINVGSDGAVSFSSFTEDDGLSNNVVYAILEDDHANLWLSTDKGLSRFDTKKNRFRNYYVSDGLQSNQFYWSAAYRNKAGEMFFGGMNGVNFFHPDSIKDDSYSPTVAITDFKIFNNSVTADEWNDRINLSHSKDSQNQIRLSYKENVFSIEFSALTYHLPEKIRYAYQMAGVDKDWVHVSSNRRFASYTNLKGGEYTFLVKATNGDGVLSEKATQLRIIVTPPFWATPLFRILTVVAAIGAVLGFIALRTRNLRNQKKKLETLVKERTAKIQEQKEQLETQAAKLTETNRQLEQRQQLIEGHQTQLELQNKEISAQRDKLIELNKRVQLVNQLKLRFFTNISHEFRTPLTLILGPIDHLIQSWRGDEDVRNTLKLINRNAQRLLHLINQLMDFRKVETGKLELKVSKGDIAGFLQELYSSFTQLACQRQIDYEFHAERFTGQQWFDHEKLENVVFNLLSNAFKFTPEKGRITLSVVYAPHAENGQEQILIKVSDTGVGIAPEHQTHIFKRFYQADNPVAIKQRGSGIGLSLAKELVLAHRGHISVESEPGKGSTFIVRIPCSRESFTDKEVANEPFRSKANLNGQLNNLTEALAAETIGHDDHDQVMDPKVGNKPVILVAEDNYDLRKFISEYLRKDYRIIETENGKEAYEKAKIFNPELIISDVMMPEMDGLELCSRIKNNILTSHIPVILLTARASVENWIEGLETGADDYIPKPFNISILEARIRNMIETHNNLKKIFRQNLVPEPTEVTSTSVDEQFLRKAISVVEEHYADSEFGVEAFVEKMSVSRSLLHKKLSAITDQSAGDFIASIRLKKSASLLRAKSGNISEIAYEVGFNDPKYFSRIFKKYFGVSPSEYVQVK